MALRSVVLAPPPGAGAPRKTVVLRPGGPKDKGKAADLVTLVLGVLLLLACVVLVNVLPNKEYALPQFAVTFPEPEQAPAFPSQSFDFVEGDEANRVHDFTYELPDNVYSFTLDLHFADVSLPGSLPDQFRVEVYDPDGNPIGPRTDLFSGAPRFDNEAPTFNFTWIPGVILNDRISIPIAPKPADAIVQGLSHLEVAEQVRARLEPQARIDSAGVWTVRVTLVAAGDCPQPGAPDTNPQQAFFCRTRPEPNDGVDRGERFTIESLTYNIYSVQVDDLS